MIIYHLPPIKGTRKQLWMYSYVLGQGALRFSSTRRQAWRINALGHPSRLKAVLDLTGYVVVSNIYLVLHPRSVANTNKNYVSHSKTAGDLVGWPLTNHQPTKKTDVVSGFCGIYMFSAFWLFQLGENKGPSWMVEVAQVGFFSSVG